MSICLFLTATSFLVNKDEYNKYMQCFVDLVTQNRYKYYFQVTVLSTLKEIRVIPNSDNDIFLDKTSDISLIK